MMHRRRGLRIVRGDFFSPFLQFCHYSMRASADLPADRLADPKTAVDGEVAPACRTETAEDAAVITYTHSRIIYVKISEHKGGQSPAEFDYS